MNKIKIFSDEDIEKLREICKRRFEQYNQDRVEIDKSYSRAEWMYNGGSSRQEYDEHRRRWVPRYPSGQHKHRANVGSTLFHRQVNTLAGILGAIIASGRDLWRYTDRPVEGSPESGDTDKVSANVLNALTKRIWELDDFATKIPEFCVDVFKYSNIFVMIGMRRVYGREWRVEETAEPTGEVTADGGPIFKVKRSLREHYGPLYEYPTITIPHPKNVYADMFIPNMKDQEIVIVLSTTTLSQLRSEGKYLDQTAVSKISPNVHSWDGMYGVETGGTNLGAESSGKSNLFLRWDCYARVPVSKKTGSIVDLSSENPDDYEFKLVWAVFVGNSLDRSAVCLKVVDGFDPDDEIPIKEVRASPDNSDLLYHAFLSDVVAPSYAADCALLNAAIDNNALVNDPPKEVLYNAVLGNNYSFEPGQSWLVRVHNAVRPVEVRDVTLQTVALRNQIEEECRRALATDSSKLGEYAGARTSATEILRVTSATDVTLAIRMAYIVGQFIPWLARKYISYIRDFMPEEVMRRMVNEVVPTAAIGKYVGNYDIHVDIVTQYEDEMMHRIALTNALQILVSNPVLMQSASHSVDVGALVRKYLEAHKLPVSEILRPGGTIDSESNARNRINLMLLTGVYQPPQQGEDFDTHLRVAVAERLRWRGLEDAPDPRAKNIPLVDQYIQDLKMAISARDRSAAQAAALGAMMASGGMGGEIGQYLAGAMGAGLGGAANAPRVE